MAAALPGAGFAAVDILLISAVAGAVIGLLNLSGLTFTLSLFLVNLAGGSLAVLLVLTATASIMLGMGMPTTGVYVLLATVIAPGLIGLGVAPLAAHMFIFYFGMLSMVTPPVAMAAFTAATLAGTPPMRTALDRDAAGLACLRDPVPLRARASSAVRGGRQGRSCSRRASRWPASSQ